MYNLDYYADLVRPLIIENLLPDTCTIYTRERINDGTGHYSISETVLYYKNSISVPCRIDPTRQYRDQDVADQELNVTDYYFSLPYDLEIAVDNVIVFGGIRYQIKKLSDAHSWKAVKRAFVVTLR